MARVTGPLMSVDASGTYGKALVFSHWKGRNYVRERVVPSNPKSAKQTGVRAMMSFLAKYAHAHKTAIIAAWATEAAAKLISECNAFISANMANWQCNFAPIQEPADTRAATASAISTQTLTGGVAEVSVQLILGAAADNAGVILMRHTSALTAIDWTKVIYIAEAAGGATIDYVDTPLDPGTYHYAAIAFSNDGKLGTMHADGTATVT
jgi:hypothetical protein